MQNASFSSTYSQQWCIKKMLRHRNIAGSN